MWRSKKKSRPLSDFLDTKFEINLVKSEDIYKPLVLTITELEDDLIDMDFDNVGSYKKGSLTKKK